MSATAHWVGLGSTGAGSEVVAGEVAAGVVGLGDGGSDAGTPGGGDDGAGWLGAGGLEKGEFGSVGVGVEAPGSDGVGSPGSDAEERDWIGDGVGWGGADVGPSSVGEARCASADGSSGGRGGITGSVPNSQSPGTIGCGKGAGAASEKDGRSAGDGNTCGSLSGVGDDRAGGGVDRTASGGRDFPHPINAALTATTIAHLRIPPITHPRGEYAVFTIFRS